MTVNTNDVVFYKDEGRTAGTDRIRIHSEWLDCPAKVFPISGTRGYRWEAVFRVTDGIEPIVMGMGTAETRKLAGASSIDWITKQIKRVVIERAAYNKRAAEADRISAEAGIWPARWPDPQLGAAPVTRLLPPGLHRPSYDSLKLVDTSISTRLDFDDVFKLRTPTP